MIKFDPNVSSVLSNQNQLTVKPASGEQEGEFAKAAKAIEKYLSKVDNQQQASDASITDLLAGRNDDIASIVAAVAKADMSFKVLVGVRNKLVEAYKTTMNMQV